jgi:hypothetical protein
MQKAIPKSWRSNEILTSLTVLAFLLVFTYGLLFVAPYPGFYFNPTDGTILDIYYDDLNPESAVSLKIAQL